MKFKTIREVFDHFSSYGPGKTNVDKVFVKKLFYNVQGFINKNDTHTAHFGGNLVGVRPVRYLPSDDIEWLENVLGIEDIRECQQALHKLDSVEPSFRVRSDITNLSFVYVMYLIENSKLDRKEKDQALIETIIKNLAKHMCSLLSHRFKFPSDEIVAQQLYESLDNKSHLKRYGSWLNMMRHTAIEMLDNKKGIHTRNRTWQTMKDDDAVSYMVGDVQDRLAGQINLLTEKFHAIKDSGDRLVINSPMNNIEGEKVLAEYVHKEKQLIRDMGDIVKDPRDLIRDELVDATMDIITTGDERMLRATLNYLSDNIKNDPMYLEAVNRLSIYIISEARQGQLNLSNIPEIIGRVRSIFRASRTRKKEALALKEAFRHLVEDAIPTARDSIKVATQLSLMIYITLRMLTISRYR